jgi:hypothetical protein
MSATGEKSIAICDRCHVKMPYTKLRSDGNSPGLKVCPDCWDTKDPYRLTARKTEQMSLQHARPDRPISADSAYLLDNYDAIINFGEDRLVNG